MKRLLINTWTTTRHLLDWRVHFAKLASLPLACGVMVACIEQPHVTEPLGFEEPYARSTLIRSLEFSPQTLTSLAPGSDNWPMTWAANGLHYTSWGDGGGFGGTNAHGRVSLGVAAVAGSAESFTAMNVFGSPVNSGTAATFDGKSYGIIALGDTLNMWVSPGSAVENLERANLYQSLDGGFSWIQTDVAFDADDDRLAYPTFLQAGRDYSEAPSQHLYVYAVRVRDKSTFDVQRPGEVMLMRVERGQEHDPDQYTFYAGMGDGVPNWEGELSLAEPVLVDPNGALRSSVAFVPGLDRYLFFSDHTETHSGNLAIFEGASPWGPWTLVSRWYNWRVSDLPATSFFWNIAPGWIAPSGDEFTLVFSGTGGADGWNSVQVTIDVY